MPVGSILKAGIKELAEDTTVPAQSVPNLLKKQGVKDEEIQYSGIELPKEGKVTKADLEKMEAERLDIFNVEEVNSYNWVNLAPGRNNPTYKEKVLTYSEKGATPITKPSEEELAALSNYMTSDNPFGQIADTAVSVMRRYGVTPHDSSFDREVQALLQGEARPEVVSSRYTSSHFGEVPNYSMHTRIYDDTLDGVPTRVVTEIQSDLHQAGRKQGYDQAPPLTEEETSLLVRYLDDATPEAEDEISEILLREGADPEHLNHYGLTTGIENLLHGEQPPSGSIPKSPFEKTWLRKGLEREISDAIDEGRSQIAIPISGAVEDLKRAPGVQKWYETTVASTAHKLAKSAGMDFEMKTIDGVDYAIILPKRVGSTEALAAMKQTGPELAQLAKQAEDLGYEAEFGDIA